MDYSAFCKDVYSKFINDWDTTFPFPNKTTAAKLNAFVTSNQEVIRFLGFPLVYVAPMPQSFHETIEGVSGILALYVHIAKQKHASITQ